MFHQVFCGDCLDLLGRAMQKVDLTFLDPPFNQQKDYAFCDDDMPEEKYWAMMENICQRVFDISSDGASLYFMQREKNAEFVLRALRKTGWQFQNLIIWKKKTSAVPVKGKFAKHYQVIVYATKGQKAKTFNRLRINPQLPSNYKLQRDNGVFVTDVWDDIRELTSGYFAGNEAIRVTDGSRFHKQQSPIALLLRIILTSSQIDDVILDPFAGTGTMAVVAKQLQRKSISIDIDDDNVRCIKNRINSISNADSIEKYFEQYICTDNLAEIWGNEIVAKAG
jgi:DNA modification methylase